MIVGTGIDLVEIPRIRASLERFGERFLNRVYTPEEQRYCLRKADPSESLAARFAAKEAGAKALGTGIHRGIGWRHIEVRRAPGEAPRLVLHGPAEARARMLGVKNIALAITHTREYAAATVSMET